MFDIRKDLPATVMAGMTPKFGRNVGDLTIQGYTVENASEPDRLMAMDQLAEMMRPCGIDVATKCITALRLRTVSKNEAASDQALTVAIYAEDLADYPRDVAIEACRRMARMSRWFPAWADLYEQCELLMRDRRMILAELERIGKLSSLARFETKTQ